MSTTEPMTQERLDAIQARVEVATDGPWAVDSDDPSYIIYSERGGWDGLVIAQVADQDGALFPVEHNGALIAHAPTDLTDLLAEVERLRDELAKAREVTGEKMDDATYAVASVHHPLPAGCLCGYKSARKRDVTEHILDQFIAALCGGDDA